MAVTWTQSIQISTSSGSIQGFKGSVSDTGNSKIITPSLAFTANSNAVSFTLAFTASLIQSLFFVASQPCTIITNNSTSPTNTLNLVAGVPVAWSRSANTYGNPLNANTNGGFLSCNAAVVLTFGILTN